MVSPETPPPPPIPSRMEDKADQTLGAQALRSEAASEAGGVRIAIPHPIGDAEEVEVTPEEEAPTESHPTTLWLEAVDPSMQEPTKSTYRELTPDMGW